MSTLTAELRTLTYTPAVCDHLEDLRRRYTEQKNLAEVHLGGHQEYGDEDGIKISQIEMTLAAQCLNTIEQHLALANREWTRNG